jgi:quinol monooxygenase YgiN
MLVRIVQLHIKPENLDLFLSFYGGHQAQIGAFRGCHSLKLLQDVQNPNMVATLSEWESEEHLNHYRFSEFFKTLWTQVKPLFESPAKAFSYQIYTPNQA